MKILHISSGDSGGAGIAALRLHDALKSQNIDSNFLCLHKSSGRRDVVEFKVPFITKILMHSHLPIGQNVTLII